MELRLSYLTCWPFLIGGVCLLHLSLTRTYFTILCTPGSLCLELCESGRILEHRGLRLGSNIAVVFFIIYGIRRGELVFLMVELSCRNSNNYYRSIRIQK